MGNTIQIVLNLHSYIEFVLLKRDDLVPTSRGECVVEWTYGTLRATNYDIHCVLANSNVTIKTTATCIVLASLYISDSIFALNRPLSFSINFFLPYKSHSQYVLIWIWLMTCNPCVVYVYPCRWMCLFCNLCVFGVFTWTVSCWSPTGYFRLGTMYSELLLTPFLCCVKYPYLAPCMSYSLCVYDG